jgi:23S rRNA pseudouridine2604 synthase
VAHQTREFQGNVFINGKRATIGDQVAPGDVVKVNGQLIEARDAEDLVFIALNKPVGIVSTTEDVERDNIVDFVNHSTRLLFSLLNSGLFCVKTP